MAKFPEIDVASDPTLLWQDERWELRLDERTLAVVRVAKPVAVTEGA